ncbi:MAG: hypothetical protein GX410_01220 [Elusimicrobia bacterium]|nr:hypothetical protein [Elusimicrobiota bacterium]
MNIKPASGGPRDALWARLLPAATVLVAALMLISLKFGFLDYFIPTTWHGRLGYDFFSVPRAFLNLEHGHSIYNSRLSQFGPYVTWFPFHPAAAVLLGSWLSLFAPWNSYAAFVVFSLLLLGAGAYSLARRAPDALSARLAWFALFCSPAAYLMLWNGQAQVLLVCALCLICADLLNPDGGSRFRPLLFAGILLSLLSKPAILPALPALFAVKRMRRTLLLSLGIYALVSALFVLVPALNPQAAGLKAVADAALHPEHMFRVEYYRGLLVRSYRPELVLDNSIHWLNMKSRMAFTEAHHFELFSLPALLDWLASRPLPRAVYQLPAALALLWSVPLYLVREGRAKDRMALAVVSMSMLAFFLSYSQVYEYHYTVALAMLPPVFFFARSSGCDASYLRYAAWFCGAAALLFAPTPYYWFRNPAFGHHNPALGLMKDPFVSTVVAGCPYGYALTPMRLFRVVPAFVMFAASAAWLLREYRGYLAKEHGKEI